MPDLDTAPKHGMSVRNSAGQGVTEFWAVAVPVAFFGMMFGAAAVAAGYTVGEAVLASVLMFAGASQFVFLDVYREGVPVWSVAFAVFAVNFRHILYSAAVASKLKHFSFPQKVAGLFLLTDLQFAATETHAARLGGRQPISIGFYFAYGTLCLVMWNTMTLVGALFGALIKNPAMLGLDFVLPVYFATILMGFRTRPRFASIVMVSAVVSIIVHKTIGAPWHISIGALAGIAVAAALARDGTVKPASGERKALADEEPGHG